MFDSGYQYIYDRFNKRFAYIPLSSDIAGLCVRTDVNQFPWFSPAGVVRGALTNAIKLAFNPGQEARDRLYTNRINPVIPQPGSGMQPGPPKPAPVGGPGKPSFAPPKAPGVGPPKVQAPP